MQDILNFLRSIQIWEHLLWKIKKQLPDLEGPAGGVRDLAVLLGPTPIEINCDTAAHENGQDLFPLDRDRTLQMLKDTEIGQNTDENTTAVACRGFHTGRGVADVQDVLDVGPEAQQQQPVQILTTKEHPKVVHKKSSTQWIKELPFLKSMNPRNY